MSGLGKWVTVKSEWIGEELVFLWGREVWFWTCRIWVTCVTSWCRRLVQVCSQEKCQKWAADSWDVSVGVVIDAISVDVIVRRVQIKKRSRDRMEPCRNALFKSKSGGTEIWKEAVSTRQRWSASWDAGEVKEETEVHWIWWLENKVMRVLSRAISADWQEQRAVNRPYFSASKASQKNKRHRGGN